MAVQPVGANQPEVVAAVTGGIGLSEQSSQPCSKAEAQWLKASWGNPAQGGSSYAVLYQLAESLHLAGSTGLASKRASKASDRATETPGAWCGSCGR